MLLKGLPLIFALVGLALYTVLARASFGAGFWQLFAGRGERAERIREHAHHSMAPVWEANHVWLIFVISVFWTAYPSAFGSIAPTLAVPLFIAAVGIIFRGAAYALRTGTSKRSELSVIDTVFSISSLLTPFALGAAVGGIASERVPVGNAAGHLFSSWLNPTSILIGVVALASSTYLAAIYLAADAARLGEPELQRAFRTRALGAGVVAGAIALVGLVVLHPDAHGLYRQLVAGTAIIALLVSVLAGIGTLALVWRRRFEVARFSAAVAVAAVIAGWALSRWPAILPGLSVRHYRQEPADDEAEQAQHAERVSPVRVGQIEEPEPGDQAGDRDARRQGRLCWPGLGAPTIGSGGGLWVEVAGEREPEQQGE